MATEHVEACGCGARYEGDNALTSLSAFRRDHQHDTRTGELLEALRHIDRMAARANPFHQSEYAEIFGRIQEATSHVLKDRSK